MFSIISLSWAKMSKGTCRLAVTLIALYLFAFVNVAYASGRVFYDGFESGNTNQWLQDDFRNRCPVVAISVDGMVKPYKGSHMLECNSNPTLAYNDPNSYETLRIDTDKLYRDELFIRVHVCLDKDMNQAQKILRFFEIPDPLYHDLFDVAGHPQNAFNNAGNTTTQTMPTYWGDAPGDNTNVPDEWHTVEYYIQQSTGTVKVWHDGVLVRNDVGLNFDGLKWTPFYITSNGDGDGGSTNHIYFDEFEIYSDLGTGGTGSMANGDIMQGSSSTAPLAPPMNLQIK